MLQSPKSNFNASPKRHVRGQSPRRSFWTFCGALALALGALGADAVAQEADVAEPAASKRSARTPAQRAEGARRRAARAAEKAKAGAVDEKARRVALALGQITAALESGQLNPEEAFDRIEAVKASWLLMKRLEDEGSPAGGPVVAKAGAKAVPASAPRSAPASVKASAKSAAGSTAKPTADPNKNLSRLVANYNLAEKTLNQRVAAGKISRRAANRELEKIRTELRRASDAAAAGGRPEDTLRYKDRARELGRQVARGLISEREAQRELRLLRKTIAAEQEIQRNEAKRAAQQKKANRK